MKLCSKCGRVYSDESLNFCLEDGESLVETDLANEMPTAFHSASKLGAKSTNDISVTPTGQTAILSDY